jgi:hypothetical protein
MRDPLLHAREGAERHAFETLPRIFDCTWEEIRMDVAHDHSQKHQPVRAAPWSCAGGCRSTGAIATFHCQHFRTFANILGGNRAADSMMAM